MKSRGVGCLTFLGVGFAVSLGAVTPAMAALEISSAPTENVSCSGSVCTATTTEAVLNAGDIANMLATGDVTIVSGNQAQDIEIDAGLSWASTQRLTLDSYHSIRFNAAVEVTGPGSLTISTDDGGSGGDFLFLKRGHVKFWDKSSGLVINGNPYELVKNVRMLRRRRDRGYYALMGNIDLKSVTYSASPEGNFDGTFEGLGNTISNLTIIDSTEEDRVGFFGELDPPAMVRDIGLEAVNITGTAQYQAVGTIAGAVGAGALANRISATGTVSARRFVGGLVGADLGTLSNSHASVAVSGGDSAGGLAGYLYHSEGISRSYSTGKVAGGAAASVGGLVGTNSGSNILDSYATGAVAGGNNALVGGLVGSNSELPGAIPSVSTSYSTGSVAGGSGATVGGLIGSDVSDSQNTSSYWDMDTSGVSNPANGAGNVQNHPGITGLSDAQLKSGLPAGFDKTVWKQKAKLNSSYPYLTDNPATKKQ